MQLFSRGIALAVLLGGAVSGPAPARAAPPSIDWPTTGYDRARTGTNPNETTINAGNVSRLRPTWSISIDGSAITAQPILAANVATASGIHDLLVVGTEAGVTAALNAATGATVWSHASGYTTPGCPNLPDGKYGISSAAVIDRSSNTVYSMGGDGKLYAYAAGTGAIVPGWPVTILADPSVEHVYGGLNIGHGGVYVVTASMCDHGFYHGRVVRVSIATATIENRLYIDGTVADKNGTITTVGTGGGGVWGAGGISIDANATYYYAATGNLNGPQDESLHYGNHILKMTANLDVLASTVPKLDCPHCDLDFGSTPVLFQPTGCAPRLAVLNKNQNVYIYRREPFTNAALEKMPNSGYVNDLAYDAKMQKLISANRNSVRAYTIDQYCVPNVAWTTPETSGVGGEAVSPPAIANGIVYYGNGAGNRVYALDLATGVELWHYTFGGSVYAQPVVVNGTVFVPTWDGKVTALQPTHP